MNVDGVESVGVDHADLLIISIGGVQRFIDESRTTADLRAGSEIFARLAAEATRVLTADDRVRLVFPVLSAVTAGDEGVSGVAVGARSVGVPNRIVALVPPVDSGDPAGGDGLADGVVDAVRRLWGSWVRDTFGRSVSTPGMPSMQWVRVRAGGGYPDLWLEGQRVLAARRRVRDFAPVEEFGHRLCSLSPRWVAEDRPPSPRRAYEREWLSAASWVKRRWRHVGGDTSDLVGFPSTASIASAPFRLAALRAWDMGVVRAAVAALQSAVLAVSSVRETPVQALRDAAPAGELSQWFVQGAGPWVYPGVWDAVSLWREVGGRGVPMPADFPQRVRAGVDACRGLLRVMDDVVGVSAPSSYLAVVLQDLDNMGRFLGGEGVARDGRRLVVGPDEHGVVSRRLVELGQAQQRALIGSDVLGVAVYAGGDDLLAFSPASTAIPAASACHGEVPADLPTASTAVLFFHRSTSLRMALVQARALLKEAKDSGEAKHALGVGFLRRSGVREFSVQPWSYPADVQGTAGGNAADLFAVFGKAGTGRGLSPRLVSELERDSAELADPLLPEELYRAELSRLVRRHGGSESDAAALRRLGMYERARPAEDSAVRRRVPGGGRGVPARAARVAVFLRQECVAVS